MYRFIFLLLYLASASFSQTPTHGSLFGKVLSEKTRQAIAGAALKIKPSDTLVYTDSLGHFYVENLPTGSYTLIASAEGYVQNARTGVLVVTGRAEEVRIELREDREALTQPVELDEKVITGGSTGLRPRGHEAVGTYRLSRQEVLSSPGTLLDISRAVQFLPGMTRNNDQSTNLIVRGGDPDEVAYLVDGIPIFSVNHFEFGRIKRGEIGNINMYFLDHLDFHNGAFAARYPDKLSGVMDIVFKKGDPQRYTGMFILDAAGTGGVMEGPIPGSGGNGTYGATFRYSSLGLLDKAGVIDFGGVPQYQNAHIKLNHKVGKANWNFNLLAANDEFTSDGIYTTYRRNVNGNNTLRESVYKEDSYTRNFFSGLRWDYPWSENHTSVYMAFNSRLERGDNLDSTYLISQDEAIFPEYAYGINDETSKGTRLLYGIDQRHFLTEALTLQYGLYHEYNVLEHERDNIEVEYFANTPDYSFPGLNGDTLLSRPNQFSAEGSYYNISVYSELLFQKKRYDLYFGGRLLYDEFVDKMEAGPRGGVKVYLGKHVLKYAGGFHTQSEIHDMFTLEDPPDKLPVSVHHVVGWERTFPQGFLAGLEIFQKETYRLARFRQNPLDPPLGKTMSRGFDVQFKKSLLKNYWSNASYTYNWNREWYQGRWIKTIFSTPHNFTGALGFDFSKKVSGSVRYSYATGSPRARAILDTTTGQSNYEFDLRERFADYHRLDVRLDYRYYFKHVSLAAFIEITNLLDHHNEFVWFNGTGSAPGWTRFPVGGLTLAF